MIATPAIGNHVTMHGELWDQHTSLVRHSLDRAAANR